VASSAPANDAEKALIQLLKDSSPQGRLVVQAAPGDTHIERVTGLAVRKTSKASLEQDAAGLLDHVLKPALGDGVRLELEHPKTVVTGAGNRRISFQQVTRAGTRDLPVINYRVTLYYKDDTLTAFDNHTVALPDGAAAGADNTPLTADRRKALAATLGVPEKTVADARLGVYLINDDPAQARVVYDIPVAVGEKQEDLHLYLCAKCKMVIGQK
jgi:hypothetical protein